MSTQRRYLRLTLPFTILTAPDTVRLVAGEDFRYTLSAPGLERWLPELLKKLDGRRPVDELLGGLDAAERDAACQLLDSLYSERVLTEASPRDRHQPLSFRLLIEGAGPLADGLRSMPASNAPDRLVVLCQDRLNYDEFLQFNQRCRDAGDHALWASTGPMQRGYVGPVILPDAGPCLACLLRQFQRLSPAPEIYDHLLEHARRQEPMPPVPFPPHGVAILQQLALWKLTLLAEADPPAALYRLHVLDVATLEVSAHRVFADPECPACGEGG
jgi:bacteriocin biosynthesis cyclodehydratase domain-containing protein